MSLWEVEEGALAMGIPASGSTHDWSALAALLDLKVHISLSAGDSQCPCKFVPQGDFE